MKYLRFIFLICLLCCCYASLRSQNGFSQRNYPLKLIFDTDFGPDYDDVGALTMLHAMADSGLVDMLATVGSSAHKNAAASINLFNTYFNRPGIPVGIVKDHALVLADKQHWTDSILQRYPHNIKNNNEAEDAVHLYRRILNTQLDHSVTIVTVGFLTNLANLMESGPDSVSPFNGYELVQKKVSLLVSMAGRFPTGNEFNLAQDILSSKKILKDWPTKILFSGFEIGRNIKTGIPLIHNDRITNSPVKDVFSICIPFSPEDSAGRMSWDETAVLIAVKGWQSFYDIQTGICTIGMDGVNVWHPGSGNQAIILEKTAPGMMTDLMNEMIMHQPVIHPDSTK